MGSDINALSISSSNRVQESAQTSGSASRDTSNVMTDEFLWTQSLRTEATASVQSAQSIGAFVSQSLRIA